MSLKLQEVALYSSRTNVWTRKIICFLKCHSSLGKFGSEQLIYFKNNKTLLTLKLFKILANLLTSYLVTQVRYGLNYYNFWSQYLLGFDINKTDEY